MSDTPSRLIALLSLLQTPRMWSGNELATRLRVSRRTVRRDVERLRDDGRLDVRVRIDATGTGQLTGDQYRLTIDTGSRSVPDKARFSFDQRFVVDNRSGGPDFTARFVLRFDNGEPTATVDDQRCK